MVFKKISYFVGLLCLLFGASQMSYAQQRSGGGFSGMSGMSGGFGGSMSGEEAASLQGGTEVLDTGDIRKFFAENPDLVYAYQDSILHGFQQYDPIRKQRYDYANLGNLGSPHRALVLEPAFRRGLQLGLDQFDLYKMTVDQLPFYRVTQSFSQFSYSQGPSQSDAQYQADFSRNFAGGINISLLYKGINNTGAFRNQRMRNNAFGVGMWYQAPKSNYQSFFTFTSGSMQARNNGGIIEPDVLAEPFSIPVRLGETTALTRHTQREFSYRQYFDLSLKKRKKSSKTSTPTPTDSQLLMDSLMRNDSLIVTDSLTFSDSLAVKDRRTTRGNRIAPDSSAVNNSAEEETTNAKGRVFQAEHQFTFGSYEYKFSDPDPVDSVYGAYSVDDRGLRFFQEHIKIENNFNISTFRQRDTELREADAENLQANDRLQVGINHQLHLLDFEQSDTILNNIFAYAKLGFSISDRVQLQTYGHLALGNQAGDYRVEGNLLLNLKKLGELRGIFINQLYEPTLVQHRFNMSGEQLWFNSFRKILQTTLGGSYELPKLGFRATVNYHLLNNYTYFNAEGIPQQSGAPISVLQLVLNQDFKLGPLFSKNQIIFQEATGDVLRLPTLYSKHSLYLQLRLFRNRVLLTHLGVDARLTTAYFADAYQPASQQFFLQNEQELPFTPLIDGFVNIKIDKLLFFAKAENLLPLATRAYYYQSAQHALPYGIGTGLRLGITWRFVE